MAQLITVDAAHRVVPAELFGAKLSEGGPSKADLLAAVRKFLEEHPEHNRTVIEQLMSDRGYSLIYTPPFCPEVQPIELLWAEVKRYVADRCYHKRSPAEARAQTEEGFERVTYGFILSIIRHCHDWIDSFLATEEAGDLRQCGTLAGVIRWLPLLRAAGDSKPAVAAAAQPMSISPSPPLPTSAPSASSRNLRKRH